MNYSLINKLYKDQPTVGVVFRNTKYKESHERVYTYLVPDGLDPKVNDLGIVEKDGVYSIVTIVVLHAESKVDPNAEYAYKWLVGLVDPDTYYQRMVDNMIKVEAEIKDLPSRI